MVGKRWIDLQRFGWGCRRAYLPRGRRRDTLRTTGEQAEGRWRVSSGRAQVGARSVEQLAPCWLSGRSARRCHAL